ncbi:Protein grpE [Reticulomyxa filosa]|uniref:Protein grpE n=1 Tax=Reticulomyxa filosa TaxID=46433 RepID=X6NZH2_RETFI|nr:Protein grpE [Reticulomyxa filosa]|eukprot:ETO31239.1 Protein grpE [Reticulomyxa filosa]
MFRTCISSIGLISRSSQTIIPLTRCKNVWNISSVSPTKHVVGLGRRTMSTQQKTQRDNATESQEDKVQSKDKSQADVEKTNATATEYLLEEEHSDIDLERQKSQKQDRDILAEYETKIKELEEGVNKCREAYAMTEADIINLSNRTKKNVEIARTSAVRKFSSDILSVADCLQQTLAAFEQNMVTDEIKSLIQGVKLTEKTILDTFGKHGIQKIQCQEGVKFDSTYHEAQSHISTTQCPPGTVVKVLSQGYTLNNEVLRPAKVEVAASSDAKKEDSEKSQ